MHVLKYKDSQLSIFDFNEAKNDRKAMVRRVNKLLGLDNQPSSQHMLEACLKHPEMFTHAQRLFIRQCIFLTFDDQELSEKQSSYLGSLFNKIKN